MRRWLALALVLLALGLPLGLAGAARAEEFPASGGNFGGAGLLETRSARMREDGTLDLGGAWRHQRQFWFLNGQVLPWLETTFRLTNRLNATTGHGTTVDRAFDAKLRLLREGPYWPALAVGLQDAVGTGLYGGEYVVLSKRFWAVDVSAGLGWGRLGSAADLAGLGHRRREVGQGGLPAWGSWFRGPAAVFAGLEWNLPVLEGLRAKLEYSGDALRDERGGWPARTTSPRGRAATRWNAGLLWQGEHVDVGAQFLHGTDFLLRLSVRLDAHRPPSLPVAAPAPLPARPAAAPPDVQAAGFAALRAAGFRPIALTVQGAEARVAVAGGRYPRLAQVAGRVARALQPVLPPGVERLRVEWRRQGVTVARLVVLRRPFEASPTSAEEVLVQSHLMPAEDAPWPARAKAPGPFVDWGVAPRLPVQLGEPRTGARWQLALAAGARVEFDHGLALAGSVSQAVAGNLGGGLPSNSVLPHVRSDLGRYARKGSTAIPALYAERIWTPAPDVFARVTAGLLEPMYAGVASEALWRLAGRGFALGLDLNWVRQRDFDQKFALRHRSAVTGHVSAYLDLPWAGLFTILRAGRYLAGDWGGTVELGRRFDSGIEIGAFATLTTVPFRRYGEGSFDKGIYLRIPLDVFGPAGAGALGTTLRPVVRDGGQRLGVDNPLWEVTREGRAEALGRGFLGFLR